MPSIEIALQGVPGLAPGTDRLLQDPETRRIVAVHRVIHGIHSSPE